MTSIITPNLPVINLNTSFTTTATTFVYTGTTQTFVATTPNIRIHMFGAAGGSVNSKKGGCGAYIQAIIPVTIGDVLEIYTSQGGIYNSINIETPGGNLYGGTSQADTSSGSGAGLGYIWNLTTNTLLCVIGGGGGTMNNDSTYQIYYGGDAGASVNGSPGEGYNTDASGKGGTISGQGGSGGSAYGYIGEDGTGPFNKTGTLGSGGNRALLGGGGGGGAGYGGGGAGTRYGGGGGGSSYLTPFATNVVYGNPTNQTVSPNATNDSFYQAGISASAFNTNGGNGLIVIESLTYVNKIITLPAASTMIGKMFIIKDYNGIGNITNYGISTSGLDKIETSVSSIALNIPYQVVKLMNDGLSNWFVLNDYKNGIPQFNFSSFSQIGQNSNNYLQFTNIVNPRILNNNLILNGQEGYGNGIWYNKLLQTSNFQTQFRFSFNPPQQQSNGFCFVISSNIATGSSNYLGYGYIGYIGTDYNASQLSNSIAIRYLINGGLSTTDVLSNGIMLTSEGSSGSLNQQLNFTSGNIFRNWVTYNNNLLTYMITDEVSGNTMTFSNTISLYTNIGSQGYYGFTSGNQSTICNPQIQTWSMFT